MSFKKARSDYFRSKEIRVFRTALIHGRGEGCIPEYHSDMVEFSSDISSALRELKARGRRENADVILLEVCDGTEYEAARYSAIRGAVRKS